MWFSTALTSNPLMTPTKCKIPKWNKEGEAKLGIWWHASQEIFKFETRYEVIYRNEQKM